MRAYQQSYPALQFAPVLKSNAYGHGLELVAEILKDQAVPFLVVDSYFETLRLKGAGIKTKLLVIGYSPIEFLISQPFKNVSFTIISLEALKELSQNLKKSKTIHLKIDSGMHRQGITAEEIDEAIKLVKNNPNIILEGICSHLADADGQDEAKTMVQIGAWNKTVETFLKAFPNLKYWHLSATSGLKYSDKINANAVRLGIWALWHSPFIISFSP